MGFGPLGIWEIIAIVGVALLIFGPARLPEIARGVGKAIRSVKNVKDEITGVVLDEEPDESDGKVSGDGPSKGPEA